MLFTLFYIQKTTGVVWDPYRLVSLVLKSLFCVQKPLGPIETRNSGANHAVLPAENDRCGLGLIESCNSAPKFAVLHAKTTGTNRDR